MALPEGLPIIVTRRVLIEWRRTTDGLHVEAFHPGRDVITGFALYVVDIRKRTDQGDFVQVRALHPGGAFTEVQLVGGSSELYHEDRVMFPLFTVAGSALTFQGKTKAQPLESFSIRQFGIWAVSFSAPDGIAVRPNVLYFEWAEGSPPRPWEFDPPVTEAPRPIRPVSGR
jgi:hypothetical protein